MTINRDKDVRLKVPYDLRRFESAAPLTGIEELYLNGNPTPGGNPDPEKCTIDNIETFISITHLRLDASNDPITENLHIKTGISGATPGSGDALAVELGGTGGISILTPDSSEGRLNIGSGSDNIGCSVSWVFNNDLMKIGTDKTGAELSILTGLFSEAIRIDSSGNVGFKTSSPGSIVHILDSGNPTLIIEESSSNGQGTLELKATRASTGQGAGNIFFNWNDTRIAAIQGLTGDDTTNKDDGDLRFLASQSGGLFEVMRLHQEGYVSVTGPFAIPDVITAPSAIVGLAQTFVDIVDGDYKILFGDGTLKTIVTD